MERATYVLKIKLPSTMIYADSVSFLTSNSEVFVDVTGFPWTNPTVNSL